ncbi:hypothetical protein M0813_17722 [Anaeramoeba flamelloides]|uniref:Uncharacterized protein n=1 Tax=Anaeramoeba flamelloides TaxID=1746091 RepID=A0ABQ8YVH0_9EUKA|nr:hypothetical protein M0813_17722 [Anaeramoeba flamelloides]
MKRNVLFNLKNKKNESTMDLLNPSKIFVKDFEKFYKELILKDNNDNENEDDNDNKWPNKLIMEKEIILMRTGKNWKQIKDNYITYLNKEQKKLFKKWLYLPKIFNSLQKQNLIKIFNLLNIDQQKEEKQKKEIQEEMNMEIEKEDQKEKELQNNSKQKNNVIDDFLFTNQKLIQDFYNYVHRYKNCSEKCITIVPKIVKKNINQSKPIKVNKWILCLRSKLFRNLILKDLTNQLEKEIEKETEKEIEIEKENEKETKKQSINQLTDCVDSIPEFYPFFISQLYNLQYDEKSIDIQKLTNFFLENDVSKLYQTDPCLFLLNLIQLTQKKN